MDYFQQLRALIVSEDLEEKVGGPVRLLSRMEAPWLRRSAEAEIARRPTLSDGMTPGRPRGIAVATPMETARRHDLTSVEGRARLLHAVAQIELSAVELALDSSLGFPEAPPEYHHEMVAVAVDEGRHFRMLDGRLREWGCSFGVFPVHANLWGQARTARDILERMAIVPRILEARGLDATPGLVARFQKAGDPETASLLETIYREEIGHVAVGSRWFSYFARRHGKDPEALFGEILRRFHEEQGRGRYLPNREARRQAGFTDAELALL